MHNETALFLKARALDSDQVIADALNMVPNISRKVREIGWSLVIEEMQDIDFHEDSLAYASAKSIDEGRRMLIDFANFLDANVDYISGMEDCIIQAWVVDEKMDKTVRELNIHWSRRRSTSHNVVPLFAPRQWRPGVQPS